MSAPRLGRLGPGIPAAEYHSAEGWLGSTAIRVAALRSVAHYLAARREVATPAMRAGALAHAATLEPERFARDFVVAEQPKCSAVTKKGAQCENRSVPGSDTCGLHGGHTTAEVWRQSLPAGTEIVTAEERDAALAAAAGIRGGLARAGLPRLLSIAQTEVTYRGLARLDDAGRLEVSCDEGLLDADGRPAPGWLPVQARIDLELAGGRALADLKGTQLRHLCSPERWAWHVVGEGLHVQAALYWLVVQAATGAAHSWTWICHEQEAPYAVRVYDAAPDLLDLGHRAVVEGLRRWAEFRERNNPWAGWPTERAAVWSPIREE